MSVQTLHETVNLIYGYHRSRLSFYQRHFIKNLQDNLSGMGEVSDQDIKDYITPAQEQFIRDIGKKFLIATKRQKCAQR